MTNTRSETISRETAKGVEVLAQVSDGLFPGRRWPWTVAVAPQANPVALPAAA